MRLKIIFASFLVLLILALSTLLVWLVTQIFSQLTPSMRAELDWKTQRGATDLAQAAELGLALGDADVVDKALAAYKATPDVTAIVAVDANDKVITTHNRPPEPIAQIFARPPETVFVTRRYLSAWAPSLIEGKAVGKVALFVSTARLEAGEKLRTRLLGAAGIGALAALGISLFFVGFMVTPLIRLSQTSLRRTRDLEIARRIQTSILPRRIEAERLQIAAVMIPAEDVGGDYYDVVPFAGGCWLGVGDVAGHGLQAGLIMLMVQSAVAALTRNDAQASPTDVLDVVNRVLYDNIRNRMETDEHVTFSLMRYESSGKLVFAGAHEDILVCRAATGRCERIATPGTWIGAFPKVRNAMTESTLQLLPGDVMVLYTDGITEARNVNREFFGLDRLAQLVEENRQAPVDEIQRRVIDDLLGFMHLQDDDVTLLVIRYGEA